jgi:hypothetical protein
MGLVRLTVVPAALLLVACGSGGGSGDDTDAEQPGEDSGADVTTGPDAGANDSGSPQDSTLPPQEDATLDVNLPDSFWTADSGGPIDSGVDTGKPCSPDGILCSGLTAEICKSGVLTTQLCTGGDVCADGYGCVTCVPGSGTCSGSTATLCNSTGTGYIVNNCDSQLGLTCQAGVCVGDCANISQSYIGCDYYSVTSVNNWLDQGTFSFAVSIANTTSKSATVNISGPHAVVGNPFTIAANSIQSIVLPWEAPLSCGAGTCNGGQPAAPTTAIVSGGAYHIKSTEPVTVYQFNARDYQVGSSFSYTNDASLLIPVNALTGNYYVATYPSFYTEPGLIDIVGTAASTKVTVTPSVTIIAGSGLLSSGGTVTLNAGDVLQITNPTPGTVSYGNDMSGTLIKADHPVEVFGGHACVYIPAGEAACDHLEEVMFPIETLGSDYIVVPPNMTGITTGIKPRHIVRIVGTVGSTTLTYSPSPNVITGTASTTVGAGGVVIFETDTPFEVKATNAIEISMAMEGSQNYGGGVLNGDPAMSIDVATAQFRTAYAFTAPSTYYINWATLIAPTGNSVTVDSTVVAAASFTAIGSSGYGYYHYKLCDNGGSPTCTASSANHTASSSGGFGIQVYGYGSYTSYWYPGGLNLTR